MEKYEKKLSSKAKLVFDELGDNIDFVAIGI